MKFLYFLILSAILLAGVVYIWVHRQELGLAGFFDAGAAGAPSGSAPDAAGFAWQKLDRRQDGFTVEMPAAAKQIRIPAYSETGGAEQVETILSSPSADTSYSVSWADNPPVARVNRQNADQTLDMARDDALARTQTTLTAESRATVQGFPAREFAARNAGGGVLDARLIFAGSRLYMLSAAFPSASARREADVARFFSSFSITSASIAAANGAGSESQSK